MILLFSLVGSALIVWFLFFSGKNKNREIVNSFSWKNDKERMKDCFVKLLQEKPINYLVISYYEYYMQYMVLRESNEVYVECVSNEYLKDSKLNQSQKDVLKSRFTEPYVSDIYGNVTKNYHKKYSTENEDYEYIYEEFLFIFTEVYTIKNHSRIFFRFQYQ